MSDNTPRRPLEMGLDTFGDVTYDESGDLLPQHQVLRNVVAEAELADKLGLHFFGVGEHHRADFAIAAPEVVLAAIAGRTKQIRLGSSVTVLSSDDPVRVFQRFSALDAISSGRAEVILGRGSFTESFPLFGYSLEQYEELFAEKLSLFVALLKEMPVTWSGKTRSALSNQMVYPPTQSGLRAWVGVGGSAESVVRAARYGLPLILAIIGGNPLAFSPFVELYRRSLGKFGHPVDMPVGVHSPGHVAETDEQARDEAWPHYEAMMSRIGKERAWRPASRRDFDAATGPDGALCIGSPETVAAKIVRTARAMQLTRFDLKYSLGTLSHSKLTRSIELYATKVVPLVHSALAS